MLANRAKTKSPQPSEQEILQTFNRYQSDLRILAGKIGELESEADEHGLVLTTLNEALTEEPDRKCFRLIGGVLVERTVKDVVPALNMKILQAVGNLAEQYKTKEKELDAFKELYKIRPVAGP
ncbi:Prefoldin [Armillaria nabsnona]|nr:Prefoldin [Armillaria nabsnona]